MFGKIKKIFKSKNLNAADFQEDSKLARRTQEGSCCGCDDGCGGGCCGC